MDSLMDDCMYDLKVVHDLWMLHPRGSYFLERGGDRIPPPRRLNLTLTKKCNLRCRICGSQFFLSSKKIPRRHMDFAVFQNIADTLFPLLGEVELNSHGEPLLYPHFSDVLDALERHKCLFRVQHNGTLLSEAMVENLKDRFGTMSLSVDATGDIFEDVRRNAVWSDVDRGIRLLAGCRNKARLKLCLYPTVTQRTVSNLIDIVRWAHELELDYIIFHDYDPVPDCDEVAPCLEDKRRSLALVANFLNAENSQLDVFDGPTAVYRCKHKKSPQAVPSPIKAKYLSGYEYPLDVDHPNAHADCLCLAPWKALSVGIDGQITPCCHAPSIPFGQADTVEEFADVWFGAGYQNLRKSLLRTAEGPCSLPACVDCAWRYAPKAAVSMCAVNYAVPDHGGRRRLRYDLPKSTLVDVRQEVGDNIVFTAGIPFGVKSEAYCLCENGVPIGPFSSFEDVCALGMGRYWLSEEGLIHFTASDNSKVTHNGRAYSLELTK